MTLLNPDLDWHPSIWDSLTDLRGIERAGRYWTDRGITERGWAWVGEYDLAAWCQACQCPRPHVGDRCTRCGSQLPRDTCASGELHRSIHPSDPALADLTTVWCRTCDRVTAHIDDGFICTRCGSF